MLKTVIVPNVVGMQLFPAMQALAKFQLAGRPVPFARTGEVTAQTPEAGAEATVRSFVDLTLKAVEESV